MAEQETTPEGTAEETASEQRQEVEQSEDIDALKKSLAEEKAKAEKYLANWQRSEADLINYKRYSEQEREEAKQNATASLMLSFLPFLDDLDRAFTAVPPKLEKHGWVAGVRLMRRKLDSALDQQGLKPIAALGEAFDPRFHEAVAQAKGKEGVVLQEIEKGYTFRDRVIRASKVIVGKGEEE